MTNDKVFIDFLQQIKGNIFKSRPTQIQFQSAKQ